MTKEEIAAYQDGAYDALTEVLEVLRQPIFKNAKDCIYQIELIVKGMEKISNRKLGRQ